MTPIPRELSAPNELEAELAGRRVGSGKTKPITVFARDVEGGRSIECVIKPTNQLMQPPLEYLCEWLGSALAMCLGIDTPPPHPVRIDQVFAESVHDAALKADLLQSVGLVFGSEYVSGDFTQHSAELLLSTAQREAAALILAFDVFVHNPDRRKHNTNLFTNRSRFLAFDHEQAFSFLMPLIGAPDPITSPALDIVEHHVFRHAFGRGGPDFGPFRSALAGLDDAALGAIAAGVPEQWTRGPAQGKLPEIMAILQQRRDAVDQWLPQVEAGVGR